MDHSRRDFMLLAEIICSATNDAGGIKFDVRPHSVRDQAGNLLDALVMARILDDNIDYVNLDAIKHQPFNVKMDESTQDLPLDLSPRRMPNPVDVYMLDVSEIKVLDSSVSEKDDTQNRQRKRKLKAKDHKQKKPKKERKRASSSGTACVCNGTGSSFLIECSGCKLWLHGTCIGLTQIQADSYEDYYCKRCSPTYGPSTKKTPTNYHRHSYHEPDAADKPTQAGTKKFIEELKQRTFEPIEQVVMVKKGYEVTVELLQETEWNKIILVHERSGLDLIIPDQSFHYKDVVEILGAERLVLAIDVTSQEDGVHVTLGDYLEYMEKPKPRDPVLNIISLEFSKTELAKRIQPPRVVKELSWAELFFSDDLPPESTYAKPEVEKYCLMSAEDSYTDFHIDFGGTSVWYHIFKGEKTFFLIEPTPDNLALYEEWMKSPTHSERFLGAETTCYKLELTQGQTILMPSGWIHAVYTPVDSLVFGGNFLHHLAVVNQFKIHDMEIRMETPERYRYPHFFTSCWYAISDLTDILADYIEEGRKPPGWVVKGTTFLYIHLRKMLTKEDVLKHNIPDTVDAKEVMKRLSGLLKKLPVDDRETIPPALQDS